jgi:hypothetical protein
LNNPDSDYACKELENINVPQLIDVDRYPIVMVDRGNCTFVTKTRNVQNLGGNLAIIVNYDDEPIELINMVDDGTGSDIIIPTILISKSDGDKLKKFIAENKNNEKIVKNILLSVEFDIVIL